LTGGNYKVRRIVSYPGFPQSEIAFETEVKAVNESEWNTTIMVNGTYDGPTDVVGVTDYEVVWTSDGESLFERGSAILELSDGGAVLSKWSSEIVPTAQSLKQFPCQGELVKVTYSPFDIDGNTMSYKWKGTVQLSN
jgi:hypothetical protein